MEVASIRKEVLTHTSQEITNIKLLREFHIKWNIICAKFRC